VGLTELPGDTGARARALKLWVVLSRAYAAVARHASLSIEGMGLTSTEFGVLEALLHKGPLLLGELRRKILLSSGGVTFVVDRLEKRGLVRREPCPTDRRAMYAVLTPEGQALIERVFDAHAAVIEYAVSGLDEEEKERATELLRALGHHAAGPVQRGAADAEASKGGASRSALSPADR
jgi:MarR family transcriptional regulator, 2-MHQ and catechol-resistance regulon repressor